MSGFHSMPSLRRAVLFQPALLFFAGAFARSRAAEAPLAELEKIAGAYEIEIVSADPTFPVKTAYGMIDGRRPERKAIQEYTSLFAVEFSLYPKGLVQRTRLKHVVMCSELSFAGQRRNAIPDFEHDTLYLDVSRGAYSKTYLRKVIHHEFFHIVDFRDDGRLYQDERWAALNPTDFKYGNGGRAVQDLSETSVLTKKFPGFLNHYSTTGVEEDKAEMFANLIVDSAYVADRVQQDRVLNSKVEQMKELLAKFCPDMNDQFWEKVRTTKRADR